MATETYTPEYVVYREFGKERKTERVWAFSTQTDAQDAVYRLRMDALENKGSGYEHYFHRREDRLS